MEGRRAHAVAHLAYARSQKSGTGILGSKRVLQGGEKSSPLVVLCDLWLVYGVYGLGSEKMWSGERNYGLGSSAGGGKYGPGSQTAGLGQAPPRPSVVRGEKLWSLVKRWWREVWSREPNRAPGSSPSPPECGPRREIMALGQARPRQSMVQGAKLRPRVKPVPARVWSREQNRAPGSPLPRPSVVQGAKLRPWVKPVPAKVWSREPNRALGHPLPRRSMV